MAGAPTYPSPPPLEYGTQEPYEEPGGVPPRPFPKIPGAEYDQYGNLVTLPPMGGGSPPPMVGQYGGNPTEGAPWLPPAGTGNGHWGYQGGKLKSGFPVGPGAGQDPADAWRWAFEQAQEAAEKGLARLGPGQFLGGTLGQGAQSNYLNPQGFSDEAMEAMKAELAQMHAGSRANSLRAMRNEAQARGVSGSMGELRGLADVRNRSTQALTSDVRQLLMERERAKLQQSSTAAQLAGQLAALEAAMNQAYATGQLSRQFPAIPGMGEEGGGGGYQWIDPTSGRVKGTPPGGWTPETFRQMQEERILWQQRNA